MSGEKDIKKPELISPGQVSDSSIKLSEKDMGKDRITPDSISSVSGIKGVIDQSSASEQGAYPPTNCYDYYYPGGYNGTLTQSDDKGYYNAAGGSYTGSQSDNNGSFVYYYPGYGPYPSGSEYIQQPYGSEPYPCYTYDSTYSGNGSLNTGSVKSLTTPSGSGKSNGFNAAKTNNNFSNRTSNYSKPIYQTQPVKPFNKYGSGFPSSGLLKGYHPADKFSSFTNRNIYNQNGPFSYQSNGRIWNNNNYGHRSREYAGRSGESEALNELTRGPRADNKNNSTNLPEHPLEKSGYNLPEFVTEYENAKFYVIKSYSEDDIHKCVKYDVWSSTPNGNKKLDAAFREAEAKASETGKECPVFLFFSVNGSGQFVGVAEMIGQVDFGKNMDFWQLDKWSGFFPIKWHIIKDLPNMLLRHIVLENNENRAVTYSRDTQEIGLKQGLEMLTIFKNHSQKTSVLDDFEFYEKREKALKAKRNARPAAQNNGLKNGDYEAGEGLVGEQKIVNNQSDPLSLVSLTQNLSLNSQSFQSSI